MEIIFLIAIFGVVVVMAISMRKRKEAKRIEEAKVEESKRILESR